MEETKIISCINVEERPKKITKLEMKQSQIKASNDAVQLSLLENKDASNENGDDITSTTTTIVMELPQKKYFRGRAHCNPLSHNGSFAYPAHPDVMDWSSHYPKSNINTKKIEILDIGCGFGGLTITLSTLFPTKVILAMEIRTKVCEFVKRKIDALRSQDPNGIAYQNVSVLRTNAMRYLPNFFYKGQIQKMFFLFS